jgi:cobalamin biosynthesis protein CobD/CbiB
MIKRVFSALKKKFCDFFLACGLLGYMYMRIGWWLYIFIYISSRVHTYMHTYNTRIKRQEAKWIWHAWLGGFWSLFYDNLPLFRTKKHIGPPNKYFLGMLYVCIYVFICIYICISLSKKAMKVKLSWEHTYSKILKTFSLLHSLKYMCNNVYLGKGRGGIACARLKLPSGI